MCLSRSARWRGATEPAVEPLNPRVLLVVGPARSLNGTYDHEEAFHSFPMALVSIAITLLVVSWLIQRAGKEESTPGRGDVKHQGWQGLDWQM